MEDRFGKLLNSPRHIARVSSWSEAQRLLSKASPAAVIVGPQLTEASQASEVVRLNDVLAKDGKKAYLLSPDAYGELATWTDMFDAVAAIVPPPQTSRQWQELGKLLTPHIQAAKQRAQVDQEASQRRAESAAKEPVTLVLRLPKITSGKLAKLPLSRVIYCLFARKKTGTLNLSSGSIQRRFAFHNGRFTEAPDHHDAEALSSAYAWPDGSFEFHGRHSVSGPHQPVYDVMIKGLKTHRSQRQVMGGLMSRMDTYPVMTHFWQHRRDAIKWAVLERFLARCDGKSSLEEIFSHMGNEVTDAFRSASFARDTDLVVFRSEKTPTQIQVEYDHESTATTSQNTSQKPTKSDRATGADRDELRAELQAFYESMKSMSAHDVFGIWEGCGREVVKETYYEMVKEHHPDVYGGNISGEIRTLAQRIFIEIRNSYSTLLKTEGEQTVPAPGHSTTSETTEARRKQVNTLRPGQINRSALGGEPSKSRPNPFGSTESGPIAMKRTPTSTHPDLEQQQKAAKKATAKKAKKSKKAQSKSTSKNANAKRPRRRDSSVDTPNSGLANAASSPEQRKEKLNRLKRRKTAPPGRKSTPIASSSTANTTKNDSADTFNLGYKKFKKHQYDEAFPYLKKAYQAEPENGLYMTFFAYCLFQTNPSKVKQSRKLLRKAIDSEHRQSLPDAHLFLGNILKAQDHEQRAYKHFKKALQLNPASRDAEREIRLYERRHGNKKKKRDSKAGGFFKKLFKE